MKIRTGFVSNSSSSSYIVAVKKLPKCTQCGRSDVNFLDLVETIGSRSDGYENTDLIARGAEKIFERIQREYFDRSNDEEKKQWEERFGKWMEAEAKGYEIGHVEISYHDSATTAILKDLRERKSAFALWCDHGNEDLDIDL